jgi:hypothetical protein
MTVVHELTACDKRTGLEFAAWAEHEEVTVHNVRFSGEAQFNLDSLVNEKNARFLGFRKSTSAHQKNASCTESYSIGCHLQPWTNQTSFL